MVPSRRIAPCILMRSSGYTVETLVTASSSTHLNLVYGRMAVCVCRGCAGTRLWCANCRSRIPHISVETGTYSSLAATPKSQNLLGSPCQVHNQCDCRLSFWSNIVVTRLLCQKGIASTHLWSSTSVPVDYRRVHALPSDQVSCHAVPTVSVS